MARQRLVNKQLFFEWLSGQYYLTGSVCRCSWMCRDMNYMRVQTLVSIWTQADDFMSLPLDFVTVSFSSWCQVSAVTSANGNSTSACRPNMLNALQVWCAVWNYRMQQLCMTWPLIQLTIITAWWLLYVQYVTRFVTLGFQWTWCFSNSSFQCNYSWL